ncbi:MAG: 4-(cytidine 5'-diphospho)-2-C-methyl-D-erythritol kinase [Luteolibacter sp.]
MRSLTLFPPAKLNLSLKILGKREDGFHAIDTLMVKLPDLTDILTFESAPDFQFTCSSPGVPTDESNLVVKAARLFETALGKPLEVHISLEKRIPHGAGLAGGSSDAASTLLGLNHWHDSPFSIDQLAGMAAEIGSDIPFFLHPGAARCTGRGEIITPVESPPEFPVLLLKPAFGVSTPDAYRRWQDSSEIPGITYAPQEIDGLLFENDLEHPVFEKHRFLPELKQWLLARPEVRAALMSGSGSTVFAILNDAQDAPSIIDDAKDQLDPTLWSWASRPHRFL